mmetsp:Transcript_18669/g.58631  ORF Transcript_18669/g.58631 Transcript_18669/m.58631 type:complete len:101 (+) Transcript_18669:147-449(+)
MDEFIGGCMRMKGEAKSIDVNMLLYMNEKMVTKWTSFMAYCVDSLEHLQAAMAPGDVGVPSPSHLHEQAMGGMLSESRGRDLQGALESLKKMGPGSGDLC